MTHVELTNASGTIEVGEPVHARCLTCDEERDCAPVTVSTTPVSFTYLCGQCITRALAIHLTSSFAAREGGDPRASAATIYRQAQEGSA
jgi:hypothetical protein